MWGTNAVNGVINIITRDAAKSQGGLVAIQGGDTQTGIRARYGGRMGENGHFRVYSKIRQLEPSKSWNGGDALDSADHIQAGFRADWHGISHFTVQGDLYDMKTEDRGTFLNYSLDRIEATGANLLARWQKQTAPGSGVRVQAYWDYIKRRDLVLFQPKANIFDFEFQHDVTFGKHNLVWGLGYRQGKDQVEPGIFLTFVPANRTLEWTNLFAKSDFKLSERFTGTLGMRLEHNDYTGLESLPSLGLSWQQNKKSLLWTRLARVVRAPSRVDREVFFPPPPNSVVIGGPNFESEVAQVFTIGYRSQVWDKLTYSVSAYVHEWDKLRSASALPVEFENKIEGEVYGLEFWSNYAVSSKWTLSGGGSQLHKNLRLKPGSGDPVGVNNDTLANDPDYYAQIRSTWKFTENSTLELALKHMGALPNPELPSYTVLDLSYNRLINAHFRLSIVAQNIGDNMHREFGRPDAVNEFGRTVWTTITWTP